MSDVNRPVRENTNAFSFPKVIAFFGVDGSGKSTQALLMAGFLKEKGFKVKQAWVRSVHTFAFLVWNIFFKFGLCRDESGLPATFRGKFAISYLNEKPYGVVSPIEMSPPILISKASRQIWALIEVISILPVILFQVYIPLLSGYTIVAERYVVDSIVSIAYFINDERFIKWRLARLLLTFIPKGTVFFFIDADYDTILGRRGKEAGPKHYTDFHRKLYSEMKTVVGAHQIDTRVSSIEAAHQKILALLENRSWSASSN
jgi:thymidylate kinase